ncbi:MAG: SpoIIE family protein phosphatase [candidate division KSB1 bacterium]|nr:SpoIIE family protein phosphatase [candidate division KSB1 bacterium]
MLTIIQNITSLFNGQIRDKSINTVIKENEILQSILNSLGEGVIVADRDGHFLYFNPTAEKILGIGLADIASSAWSTVYGTYYPDQITPYPSDRLPLARAIRGEFVYDELIFIRNSRRPDGIFIEVTASPMRDASNLIIGGVVILRDVSKIKQVEAAQKQSEERLSAQFKNFPIPTYVWQNVADDFVLVDFNNAARNFTHGAVQGFLGQKMSAIFQDEPDIRSDFQRCFKTKMQISREMNSYRLRTTHERKDLMFSYVFIPPNLILLHTTDMTEQKKNLATLRKLSNAVQQTADSVMITNKKGVIEYVNPAFETTTGFSRAEALGQTPKILQSGMHDQEFYQHLWKTILGGKPYRGTIINRKKNGELYWSEQTITAMRDEHGKITNFVSVLKDITELRQKQEQEFQLRIAHELQQRYYRAKAAVPGFDIAGATYSAVATNGDYFDFIPMKNGQLGLVIGDVSGHGVSAALIMAQTRASLRALAKVESDPGILLTWLNQELAADLDQIHYVTLILARLDPATKMLDYASAGHLPTYLLNRQGQVYQTLSSTGIPLGIVPDYQFTTSAAIQLSCADILFFLTDGITEAQASDESEFGVERALRIVRKRRGAPAKEIMESLYCSVRSFARHQPQEDDITTIICKVTDKC